MMKKILTGLLILLVGVLAAIGQYLYVPEPPNCEPAATIYEVATSHNDIFVKASLGAKEMYKFDWKTLHWTELPVDTSLNFVDDPDEWSFLDNGMVVTLVRVNPYLVDVGPKDYRFCFPEK